MKKIILSVLMLVLSASSVSATEVWRDMNAPMHDRIVDLLSKMTPQEKMSMMVHNAQPIPRLGIEKYYMGNESLHGVMRPGHFTVFPQALAMAATWNPDIVYQVSTAISDEARGRWNELDFGRKQRENASDLLTMWSPVVNLGRDPRWGRTTECYGEDPCLTSAIGVAYTKGLQGNHPKYVKVISTAKHFAAYSQEEDRGSNMTYISERNLREYYFTPFENMVKKANVQSVMAAYNGINGLPCHINPWLLQHVLRDEWGFEGYVVSDCVGPVNIWKEFKHVRDPETAAVLLVKAGLDIECDDAGVYGEALHKAYEQYRVSDEDLDKAVYRLLRARFMLGLFDDPAQNPYNDIKPEVVGCKEHQELALETARQSLVLLKNEKNFLPLNAKKLKKVAVIGPFADRLEFGDYSGWPVNESVTVLNGIRRLVGDQVEVITAPWVSDASGYEPVGKQYWKNGLKAEYFSNMNLEGTPNSRMEEELYYDPANQPPQPVWPSSAPMSIRWTGDLVPPISGNYTLSFKTDDGVRVWIDGEQVIDAWTTHPATVESIDMTLEAGRAYNVKVEYFDGGGDRYARMFWMGPEVTVEQRIKMFGDAGKAAKEADVVIAVMGIDRSVEHEGQDRAGIQLPPEQREFIREISKINPNTVMVLTNGNILAVNWENDHLPAILESWFTGEQSGTAVAEALFGKYNPGGRLPLTFYKSLSDISGKDDYNIENGRTYQYFKGTPLYAFGYGLSYTKFKYENLSVDASGEKVKVKFNLKNVGKYAGDEVSQVYVTYPETGVYMPIKQLKGFKRVSLEKGQKKEVEIEFDKSDLRYWDEKAHKFVTPEGQYELQVGGSSDNILLRKYFDL